MSEDNAQFEERLGKLEAELADYRNKLEAQASHPMERLRAVARFFLSYWTLFSFLFAVIVMVYVKYTFDIDYFENYRNQAEIRDLSDFHRKMGDQFIGKTEWQAAEKAYQQALDIDKNNIQAAYGLVKSQVFLPLEGKKYYDPEIVNTRLNYLEEFFPNDYLLSYLRATYYVDKQELGEAQKWFEKSMQQNPDYSWNHVAIGYIRQQNKDFAGAIQSFQTAIKLDPENDVALSNLGFAYLYTGEFKQALTYLTQASDISPRFTNYYGIAEANLYNGDVATALAYRKVDLEQAEKNDENNERFLISNNLAMYNYMPLKAGDKETITQYVEIAGIDKQRALIYLTTSLDYAFNKDMGNADALFKKGMAADKDGTFTDFFVNKITSLQNFLKPDDGLNQWLEDRKAELLKTGQT
jgi:tetratricopeptide (TPR) repeat protein